MQRIKNTDTGIGARNQANGANGEQQPDRMTTAISTQLWTYLKARWRLMESFEKHFICLETILVTLLLLSLPPQVFLDKSLEFTCDDLKIKSKLTTLVIFSRDGVYKLLKYSHSSCHTHYKYSKVWHLYSTSFSKYFTIQSGGKRHRFHHEGKSDSKWNGVHACVLHHFLPFLPPAVLPWEFRRSRLGPSGGRLC